MKITDIDEQHYIVEHSDGSKYWYYQCDQYSVVVHRTDGPAIMLADGTTKWCDNGKFHRDGGPAIEYANGSKYWYKYGELHNNDGPAIILDNNTRYWYKNGKEQYKYP